jgi:uncharacterized protein involved in type VI secretion and phage assembly
VFPGVYRAVVTDTEDPLQRGRVQVEIPSASGEERAWAPIVIQTRTSPLAPEPGDEVVVAFEAGDPTRPFVLGMLWSASAGQSAPER